LKVEDTIMLKTEYCPACGSRIFRKLKEHVFKKRADNGDGASRDIVRERLWILFNTVLPGAETATFNILRCESCGLIFTDPRFTEDEMKLKYDAISELGGVKRRLEEDPPIHMEKRASRIYGLVDRFICDPRPPAPRILDYGGASGYILLPFVKSYECGVLDYEEWKLPEGIKYWGKDLSSLDATDRFDAILLLHTLEHIIQPRELLTELCCHLNDGGILYIEVPLGCFQEWRFIREPLTHINFFSEESLCKCFARCGLKVLYVRTSYQRVTRGKTWCVNILGGKQPSETDPSDGRRIRSTREQMSRLRYYLPYALNRRAIRKVLAKLVGI
jgi:SAM-dependent methyltransferase